jgi:EAL and modified HD-GYP domain-containing signal transduction protein
MLLQEHPFLLQLFPLLPIVRYVGNISSCEGIAPDRVRDAAQLRYVARQPIVDCNEQVFGYELLFRNGMESCFNGNPDEASRATLDSSLLMGLDVLCDGRRAFVNCTRDTLIKGLVTLLPPNSTVVEVLESVPADPDVVAACSALKKQGYAIALDDYVSADARESLASLADIIKVEMQLTTEEQRTELVKQFGSSSVTCWRRRLKLVSSLCVRATRASSIFKDISSAALNC